MQLFKKSQFMKLLFFKIHVTLNNKNIRRRQYNNPLYITQLRQAPPIGAQCKVLIMFLLFHQKFLYFVPKLTIIW